MLKRQSYDYKTDVWSLGVALYQIASLKFPFEPPETKYDVETLFQRILHKEPKQLPVLYSKKLNDFILSMLDKRKDNR